MGNKVYSVLCVLLVFGAANGAFCQVLRVGAQQIQPKRTLTLKGKVKRIQGSLFAPTVVQYVENDSLVVAAANSAGDMTQLLDLSENDWIDYSENGRFAVVSTPGLPESPDTTTNTVYDLSTMRKLWSRQGLWAHSLISNDGNSVVFYSLHPQHRFLLEFYDGRGNLLRKRGPFGPAEGDIQLTASGQYLVVGYGNWAFAGDAVLKLFDRSGRELATFSPLAGTLKKVSISPDGSTVVACFLKAQPGVDVREWTGTVYVLNNNLAVLAEDPGTNTKVNEIAFTPDSRYFALASPSKVTLRESATGQSIWDQPVEVLMPSMGSPHIPSAIAVGQSSLATAVLFGRSRIFVLDSRGAVLAEGDCRSVNRLEFSSDSRQLAVGSDTIQYYDLPNEGRTEQ